jgi:hypothetical protein
MSASLPGAAASQSTFPPPPAFYKLYTAESEELHNDIKQSQSSDDAIKSDNVNNAQDDNKIDIWQPPRIPNAKQCIAAPVIVFGEPQIPSQFFPHNLPQGIKQLFDTKSLDKSTDNNDDENIDFTAQLTQLNASILNTFTKVCEELYKPTPANSSNAKNDSTVVATTSTASLDAMTNQLSHEYNNILHLLTALRKHQSAQNVIQLLNQEIVERRQTIASS